MRLADMTTLDILAKYGLKNPHADVLEFQRQAEALADRLKLTHLETGFSGKRHTTFTSTRFSLTARDEWNQQLAISRDNAADVLADTARENARRFGRKQSGQWPPKLPTATAA